MGEHDIWFDLIPGVKDLKHSIAHAMGKTWLGGEEVHELNHVVMALFIAAVVVLLGLSYRKRVRASADQGVVPESAPNARAFVETISDAALGMLAGVMGEKAARKYLPLVGTFAFFILLSNLSGAIPGFHSPTSNFNTTLACALIVFLIVHIEGVRANGLAYFKHFFGPVAWLAPLMLPIEIFSHLLRPVSLSVRLMCNMFADHTLLLVFLGLVPLVVPLPVMALGLIVSVVQTAVFCLLTAVYIAMAIEHHDEHGDGEAAHAH
jgi:F-type H+-transporting ATPase subunit a